MIMTQSKNNLYLWTLIFGFHIIFMCREIFFFFFFFSNKNMFRPSEALAREEHAGLAHGL